MKVHIEVDIDCDHAAFYKENEDDEIIAAYPEVIRILKADVLTAIEKYGDYRNMVIRDINNNIVGTVVIKWIH